MRLRCRSAGSLPRWRPGRPARRRPSPEPGRRPARAAASRCLCSTSRSSSLAPARGARRRLVLVVADLVTPGRAGAFAVHLEHREMRHEAVLRRAVPVVLTGLEEDAISGADDLGGPAAAPAEADALGDTDGLTVGVGMPRRSRTGGEVRIGCA